jgi:hypothetical protein
MGQSLSRPSVVLTATPAPDIENHRLSQLLRPLLFSDSAQNVGNRQALKLPPEIASGILTSVDNKEMVDAIRRWAESMYSNGMKFYALQILDEVLKFKEDELIVEIKKYVEGGISVERRQLMEHFHRKGYFGLIEIELGTVGNIERAEKLEMTGRTVCKTCGKELREFQDYVILKGIGFKFHLNCGAPTVSFHPLASCRKEN